MNAKKQHWVLYLITTTILITIGVQFFWNYKNYQENKQRVLNEIQISLDNSLEEYYINLSKQNFFTIVEPEELTKKNKQEKDSIWIEIFKQTSFKKTKKHTNDNLNINITSVEFKGDSLNTFFSDKTPLQNQPIFTQISKDGKSGIHLSSPNHISRVQVFKGKKASDSLKLIKGIQTMIIAIHNDSINYKELDSLFTNELQKKGIGGQFYFTHLKQDTVFFNSNSKTSSDNFLITEAKSTFLKPDESFVLHYTNPTKEALKRSLTGIFLSLLLSLVIIASLFYLLNIINKQKELAEIKNDLISNITHEFKTPITTVSTALEAIESFNAIDDKEKTKKYVSISTVQLKKLHQMVEKLLETATLDSENLLLKKEAINVIDLIEKITQKHQLICPKKNISFSSNIDELIIFVDTFHFENAISNLIDNAVKYGGKNIEININTVLDSLQIAVADDGNGIEKNQQEKIFDKFYRIPKGNTHDVKGFGIGLYYTKKIIEKHDGAIAIVPKIKNTVFKIILPLT